jgi:hypothetical protein
MLHLFRPQGVLPLPDPVCRLAALGKGGKEEVRQGQGIEDHPLKALLSPFHFSIFLPPFALGICFCGESSDRARGWRGDLRKHRPGSTLSSMEPKGIPQRKAAGLRPRLVPWKDHRLVISRSAALSPCPAATSKSLTPFILFKKEGKFYLSLTSRKQANYNSF